MSTYAADLNSIREAAARIAPWATRTPVFTCATLDRMAGRSLFFKCEQWQKAGAFKFRGACNAIMRLPDDLARRGVVTHSSGNHAQAVAKAAGMRGIPAHIVMPKNASPVKRRAVEDYGGKVIECEPNQRDREATADRVLAETGGVLIHAYDNADVIAGQGTTALELLDQVTDLDAVITPVGGGGLLSGMALAVHELKPSIRVFAAEPAGADDAARSKAAGKIIPQTGPKTIADGLLTSLGEMTWPIIRDCVERVVTVEESEIVQAMRLLWERAKLLVEPSAAVTLAAVLTEKFRGLDGLRRIGIVLSGGNVDVQHLPF